MRVIIPYALVYRSLPFSFLFTTTMHRLGGTMYSG